MTKAKGRPQGEDYAVGYGRPPAASRFKKGRSGNPEGRGRGDTGMPEPNLLKAFRQAANQKLIVTIDGKKLHMTQGEAIVYRLFADAIKGNSRATKQLIDIGLRFLPAAGAAENGGITIVFSPADAKLL